MSTAERIGWALWLAALLAPYIVMLALPLAAIVMAVYKDRRKNSRPPVQKTGGANG